jgi:hypothetical protein
MPEYGKSLAAGCIAAAVLKVIAVDTKQVNIAFAKIKTAI